MHKKEWRPAATRLKRHQHGPSLWRAALCAQQSGLRLNRSVTEQRRQRHPDAKITFDLGEESNGLQRIAAENEKVIVPIDGRSVQHTAPQRPQFLFEID